MIPFKAAAGSVLPLYDPLIARHLDQATPSFGRPSRMTRHRR